MTNSTIKVYWDACVWISLINEEAGRVAICRAYIEKARAKKVEIWTSTLSLAEVYKMRCEDGVKSIPAAQDKPFEDFLLQDFVREVQLTHDIGVRARSICRNHGVQKPNDGIHLASALFHNVDELHTFDREDLLKLDGKLDRRDGTKLKICEPKMPPPDEDSNPTLDLFPPDKP